MLSMPPTDRGEHSPVVLVLRGKKLQPKHLQSHSRMMGPRIQKRDCHRHLCGNRASSCWGLHWQTCGKTEMSQVKGRKRARNKAGCYHNGTVANTRELMVTGYWMVMSTNKMAKALKCITKLEGFCSLQRNFA
jgi:hypothetical protein